VQELQKQFTNHLAQYFLTKIVDKTPATVALRAPVLTVSGEDNETEIGLLRYTTMSNTFFTGKRDNTIAKVERGQKNNTVKADPSRKEKSAGRLKPSANFMPP
jgi:hypothetical protein